MTRIFFTYFLRTYLPHCTYIPDCAMSQFLVGFTNFFNVNADFIFFFFFNFLDVFIDVNIFETSILYIKLRTRFSIVLKIFLRTVLVSTQVVFSEF